MLSSFPRVIYRAVTDLAFRQQLQIDMVGTLANHKLLISEEEQTLLVSVLKTLSHQSAPSAIQCFQDPEAGWHGIYPFTQAAFAASNDR